MLVTQGLHFARISELEKRMNVISFLIHVVSLKTFNYLLNWLRLVPLRLLLTNSALQSKLYVLPNKCRHCQTMSVRI